MRLVQLDGLRALALMMVFLLHHSLLRSGWAGVDIFFVLSGFLITNILRREADDPRFWRNFYVKRAARILPPLLLLVSIVMLVQRPFRAPSLGYLLFSGNILQLTQYRVPALSSLWSLAIEEHFYFFWPFAVRYLRRRSLLRLSIAIVVLSPLLRIIGTLACRHWWGANTGWDNPIFLLTPFRIDGLAAGATLSLLLEGSRRPRFLVNWSGIGSTAPAALFFFLELVDKTFRRTTDNLLFNALGYSLIVLASMFLISYLVLHSRSLPARALSSRPLIFIGTVSYGFYLYQESIILWVRSLTGPRVSLRLLCLPDFIVTGLLAVMSFYAIEKPIMAQVKMRLDGRLVKPKEDITRSARGLSLQEKALEIPGGAG